jgi:PAP2 superfamily
MKYRLVTSLLVVAGLVVVTLSAAATTARPARAADLINVKGCLDGGNQSPLPAPPCPGDDVILRWNEQLLATIRNDPAGTGPVIAARALGVLHTATYDAWAAYDSAKATLQNGNTDQPLSSDSAVNDANKSKAISFAAYDTLVDLFPYRQPVYASQMAALYGNTWASDPSAPVTVGKNAAQAVVNFRHNDRSNQSLPDDNGKVSYPYLCDPSKTKCYAPTREWWQEADPWHWKPLCVPLPASDATTCPSTSAVQRPLAPHWGNVIPFATSPGSILVTGPPKDASGKYSNAEVATALTDTNLGTDYVKKVKTEYWLDGANSEFPPGHAAVFAQALSRKNKFTLDRNVKLFFALGNAVMDAGIASWWQKYRWDFWRPITAIRHLYATQTITSWLGPGTSESTAATGNFGPVSGKDWRPYQPLGVVTPPFPEYVSGHSTFTAAGSYILMNFTSSDVFGGYVDIAARSSRIEQGVTPPVAVRLSWPTFTEAAREAGMSRRYGGIHFVSGDVHGRALGDIVGRAVWSRANAYFQGKIGYAS